MKNQATQNSIEEIDTHNLWSFSSLLMVVLWPGFLMACVACGIFFSLTDPTDLIILNERIQIPALGVYTIGFLMFWCLGSFSSYLTAVLLKMPALEQ